MSGEWTARCRNAAFGLRSPVEFSTATLVESYNLPDMLSLDGQLSGLRPALQDLNSGMVLYDDFGQQRFSGFLVDVERRANGTCTLIYAGDLARLFHRHVYPVYNAPWSTVGQTAAYDNQSGPAETRLLAYINRNAGPIALNAGGVDRRIPTLTLPASAGRGPNARTSARFDNLLTLAGQLAESANLRVTLFQGYTGTTPHLDVAIADAPDLSTTVRFGSALDGGPYLISSESRYKLAIPVGTAILDAAGGEGKDRFLMTMVDSTAQLLWGHRVESFLDNRGSGDLPNARQGLAEAVKDRTAAQLAQKQAQQRRDLADAVLDSAKHALSQSPSNSSAQAAKNKAQDQYDDAVSKLTDANQNLNAAQAGVTQATAAVNAAQVADTAEITQNMTEALADLTGQSEISIPLAGDVPGLGTTIPVGAKVQASIDGLVIVERIRQIETTISLEDNAATVKVAPLLGAPDVQLLSPTQKALKAALLRISNLERTL